jgi:hypothetical protein
MRPIDRHAGSPASLDCYEPTPDVWWGSDGIDALLWSDPPPYADPLVTAPPVQAEIRFVDSQAG